jgi:hypothetical protein
MAGQQRSTSRSASGSASTLIADLSAAASASIGRRRRTAAQLALGEDRRRSRRWLIGLVPVFAVSTHSAKGRVEHVPSGRRSGPDVVRRRPDRLERQPLEIDEPFGEPFQRAVSTSSTPVTSTFGMHSSSDGALPHRPLAERRQDVADVVEERPVRPRPRARRRGRAGLGARTAGTRPGGAQRRSCRCPGPPCTISAWSIGARITTSCSAWIVATISRIAPERAAPISASTGSGMPTGDVALVGVVEVLVEVGGQLPVGEREPATERHAERVDRGRPVERRRDRRPPVDDDRIVVVVLDVAPTDVPIVDAPEEVAGARTAEVLEGIGDGHLDVLLGDLVGGAVGIDRFQALDHPVARSARRPQSSTLLIELGKQVGPHGIGQPSGQPVSDDRHFPDGSCQDRGPCCSSCRSRTCWARSRQRS